MSCKHLVKRKNSSVYHYRIIAPTDLKSVLIQQSLEISLFTGIHRIAQSRARKLKQFVQNLFQAYREGTHGISEDDDSQRVCEARTRKDVSSC